MSGRRDPVKKNMDILHKPRTFRDRSKDRPEEDWRDEIHPKHQPYNRTKQENYMAQHENFAADFSSKSEKELIRITRNEHELMGLDAEDKVELIKELGERLAAYNS